MLCAGRARAIRSCQTRTRRPEGPTHTLAHQIYEPLIIRDMTGALFNDPNHPYTQMLFDAAPGWMLWPRGRSAQGRNPRRDHPAA
ncbi:hypothetical protein [uncultured Roseovarius sp.]|uniref:hypothetical protein n=1 Tax=uncultured Roseovarius sp. TaxID=293344 RepID=UPI00343EDB8B